MKMIEQAAGYPEMHPDDRIETTNHLIDMFRFLQLDPEQLTIDELQKRYTEAHNDIHTGETIIENHEN